DDLAQETHGFLTHLAGFPSTMYIPDKTRRSIHQDHGPSLGRVWSDFLVHPRVQLIPFDHLLQKLMRQGKQEERFFYATESLLPAIDTVFAHTIEARGGVDADPFGQSRQDLHNDSNWCLQMRQGRMLGF